MVKTVVYTCLGLYYHPRGLKVLHSHSAIHQCTHTHFHTVMEASLSHTGTNLLPPGAMWSSESCLRTLQHVGWQGRKIFWSEVTHSTFASRLQITVAGVFMYIIIEKNYSIQVKISDWAVFSIIQNSALLFSLSQLKILQLTLGCTSSWLLRSFMAFSNNMPKDLVTTALTAWYWLSGGKRTKKKGGTQETTMK